MTTVISCPCCKAANDAGPACRRCKADLGPMFAVAARRDYLTAVAADRLRAGRPADARAALAEAAALGADVRRLAAVAHLLAGDFPAALAAYHGPGLPPPGADCRP